MEFSSDTATLSYVTMTCRRLQQYRVITLRELFIIWSTSSKMVVSKHTLSELTQTSLFLTSLINLYHSGQI